MLRVACAVARGGKTRCNSRELSSSIVAASGGVNTYGTRGVRYMSVGTPTTGEDSVASPEAGDAGGVKDRVKKSPLYTRTGDRGTSMLFNGERRSKSDQTFRALGDQDELNAIIGVAREYSNASNNGLEDQLIEIQCRLFDLGAAVATPIDNSSSTKLTLTKFDESNTKILEKWIDELDAQLPPLKNFVIPSGGLCSVHFQLARTVCRRAERSVVTLVQDDQVDGEVGKYLNRLSDYLFAAARYSAKHDNNEEIIWRKKRSE